MMPLHLLQMDGTQWQRAVAREEELLPDVVCETSKQGAGDSLDGACGCENHHGLENSVAGMQADR